MERLEVFLGGGSAALLILVLVAAEFLGLAIRHRGRAGATAGRWLSPLVAGAALVCALWMAQRGAPPLTLGPILAVAGLSHLLGFRERWRA